MYMYNPKVSILVPVYGVERYIEKCARSLFEQTYADIEYIFVNDCTKDHSIDVLKSVIAQYPERSQSIRIIEHTKNLGLAGARNTAVAEARGEYVLHVDSDDYLDVNAVAELVRKAISEKADIVAADMYWQFPRHTAVIKYAFYTDKQAYLKALISKQASANVAGRLIRRALYIDNSIEVPVGLNYGEDYYVYPCLVYFSHNVAYLSSPVYHYVQYNNASYIHNSIENNTIDLIQAISLLEAFFRMENMYSELVESFDLARLKVKASAVFLSSLTLQRDFAKLFPNILVERYRPNLSMQEYMILQMGRRNFFILINIYRRLYVLMGKIKRACMSLRRGLIIKQGYF